MSIRIPIVNYQYNTAGAMRFNVPDSAAQKPANTAFVLGMWIKCPSSAFENTRVHTFMGRNGTNTGGNDGYVRFTSNSMNTIEALIRVSSPQFTTSVPLTQSAYAG